MSYKNIKFTFMIAPIMEQINEDIISKILKTPLEIIKVNFHNNCFVYKIGEINNIPLYIGRLNKRPAIFYNNEGYEITFFENDIGILFPYRWSWIYQILPKI